MKKAVLTILKVLLVLVVIAVLGFLIYEAVGYFNWPLWMGGAIILLIFALVIGVIFIRKLLFRRREEGFIKQVIEQDDSLVAEKDRARRLGDLQDQWKRTVRAFKRSHLKKMGNPLYVLPWYIMVGEPDSGKSTALRNSGLTSASLDIDQPLGTSSTKNCDWWFFKDAIILDTTGRYAKQSEENGDRAEWKKFLYLLYKYRKKEPINGLVVSVSANMLSQGDRGDIEAYGRNISRTVDQLMRALGTRFPIYVMVTKTDQVQGMTAFCDFLSYDTVKQAMGHINYSLTNDSIAFLGDAMHNVTERLKDLRILLLQQNQDVHPNLLIFPDEISRLKPGLEAFFHGAFQENPYNEPPMLRGLFFSSGMQEGSPHSHILESLGVGEENKIELPDTQRGLFLYDFFTKVLPADRNLATPLMEFLRWRRLTRSLGLTAWVAMGIALCAVLTMSFLKNMHVIESFEKNFLKPGTIETEGGTMDNIIKMQGVYEEIVDLEKKNRYWWLPRLGLKQSSELERELKDKYLGKFDELLMDNIDGELTSSIDGFSKETEDEVVGDYIEHLVKRINVIKVFLKGGDMNDLKSMPKPFYAGISIIPDIEQEHVPIMNILNTLYYSSLLWSDDLMPIKIELTELESKLLKMIELKGNNMKWLAAWANKKQGNSPVTFNQFWDVASFERLDEEIYVGPAYTLKGKETIGNFISQLETAILTPSVMGERKKVFDDWYANRYIYSWYNFSNRFLVENSKLLTMKGLDPAIEVSDDLRLELQGREEWQRLTNKMTTLSNPYFDLLDRMAVELKHLKDRKGAPAWIVLVTDFHMMRSQAASEGFLEDALTLARTVKGGQVLIAGTQEEESGVKGAKISIDVHLKALKFFQDYQNSLVDIFPILDSRDHAYHMASQLFKEISDDTTEGTPFDTAFMSVESMKVLLGNPRKNEKIFWELFKGPLDFLLYYTSIETACSLQSAWNSQILAEVQGTPDEALERALFSENGAVWEFIDGPAKPFLSRNKKGYFSRSFHGASIPFFSGFSSFLKRGTMYVNMLKSEYDVKFKVVPTEVNDEAQKVPYVVIMELQCSDGVQRLENYNFPVTKYFKWTQEKCGDLKIQIIFKDMVLIKKYRGNTGFPEFLSEIRSGERVYYPDDFPTQMIKLVELDIDQISVRYEIEGHEPLIRLIEVKPLDIPDDIVYCWN